MKRCPDCGRTFTNNTLINCLNDGTLLVEDVPAAPSFGASAALLEMLPAAAPDAGATVTYANTPLSAIPELQSPEMQAALKEALEKAGMSSLLGADLQGKSTISVTTSTTTSQGGTPFFTVEVPPGAAASVTLPAVTAIVAPRRKKSPWGGLVILFLVLLAVAGGVLYISHIAESGAKPGVTSGRTP